MVRINKKAFDVEFNWIFVIIAGTIILTFFFMIAEKQKTASRQKLAAELSTEFESAFVSAIQSKGTTQPIPLPTEGIQITCGKTQVCDCKYTILGQPNDFGDKILFSPKQLNDVEAQLKTLDWNVPFRATNFLYITTSKIKYVIVYTDNDAPIKELEIQLLKDLPATLTIQPTTNQTSITYDQQTRIIFLVSPDMQALEQATIGKDVSAVYIDKTNNKATFYNKKQNSNTYEQTQTTFITDTSQSQSINNAMMYAAIFAEDPHLYQCQIKEAYKKLNYITSIIISKANSLVQEMQNKNKTQCPALYPINDGQTLQMFQQAAQNAIQNSDTATNLIPLAQQLQTQNKELLTNSCTVIY